MAEHDLSARAAAHVAAIVEAAEEVAAGLRADAEEAAAEMRESAERDARKRFSKANEEAAQSAALVRAAADADAREIRQSAAQEAREVTSEAREAARDALEEGTELADDLRALSASLRTNAERLLRDVSDAHARLTERLESLPGAEPQGSGAAAARPGRSPGPPPDIGFDVPEFTAGR